MDILRSLRALRDRKGIFFLATLLALFALVFAPSTTVKEAKLYQSSAKILVTPSSSAGSVAASGANGVTPNAVQAWFADESTLRELVTSEELLNRVIAKLKISQNWMTLRGQITVAPVRNDQTSRATNLYRLAAFAADPETSRKLASTLGDEFTLYVQELSAREYSNTRRFLEELVGEAERKVKASEAIVAKMRKEDVADAGPMSPYAQQSQSLTGQKTQLAVEEGKLRSQVEALQHYTQNANGSAPPWAIVEQKSPNLTALETELGQRRMKLDELNQYFVPGSPMVKDQEDKVAKIQETYNRELQSYIQSLLREKTLALEQTHNSLGTVTGQLDNLLGKQLTPGERLQKATAERQLQMWQENYLSLTKQLYQLRVLEQASRRQGAITILERPQAGTEAVSPGKKEPMNPLLRFALGVPFCFLFGAGAALAADYLFASMRLQPRIEEALNLPVIALIPPVPKDLTDRWDRMKKGEPVKENAFQ